MSAALGPGSWRTTSSRTSGQNSASSRRGHAPRGRRQRAHDGSPNVSETSIGVKASAQPSRALSSTGISTIMPRTRSGAVTAASSVAFAPSDVPPTTASSISRWSSSATICSP